MKFCIDKHLEDMTCMIKSFFFFFFFFLLYNQNHHHHHHPVWERVEVKCVLMFVNLHSIYAGLSALFAYQTNQTTDNRHSDKKQGDALHCANA